MIDSVRKRSHHTLQLRHHRRAHYRAHFWRKAIVVGAVILVVGVGAFIGLKQLGAPSTGSDLHLPFQNAQAKGPEYTTAPEWPAEHVAAAAIGVHGQGMVAQTGDTNKRPIASVAKVITCLALIEKHNLKPGEAGPDIPFTPADEALYQEYIAKNGSVIPVTAGESMSLRHAIEAMMLPSANNIADTAAIWGFGSMEEYHKYANNMLKKYGLRNTTVGGDASGYSPETVSTTEDLIKLGELALNAPVLMEVAGLHQTDLPGVAVIENFNRLVTQHGYTGLKPGDTDEAGRTLIFTTKHKIDGKEINLIGAVLGVGEPLSPYDVGFSIMESAKSNLQLKQ